MLDTQSVNGMLVMEIVWETYLVGFIFRLFQGFCKTFQSDWPYVKHYLKIS